MGDIRRIQSRLRRQSFDVMVVHTSHEWHALFRDVPMLAATRGMWPATVVQLHGSHPERLVGDGWSLYRALSDRLIGMCDAVFLLSNEERRQWEQARPKSRFYLVDNPFVGELPANEAGSGRSWPKPDGTPVLLFAGRLIREKGIFDLLEATAILNQQVPCHLVVAGDGPEAQLVRERVADLRLTGCVQVAGYLTGNELAAAYHTATLFVLPTYWAEGFPTVVSEAMDAGLPIVTTRMRGVADHLVEGVNALFVPAHDPQAQATTLARLLSDPVLRANMAQANREKVREFAPEVVGRHYLKVLEQVVATRRAERGKP
jgi:glycosyltransferase involved in cell wall biosynthesis